MHTTKQIIIQCEQLGLNKVKMQNTDFSTSSNLLTTIYWVRYQLTSLLVIGSFMYHVTAGLNQRFLSEEYVFIASINSYSPPDLNRDHMYFKPPETIITNFLQQRQARQKSYLWSLNKTHITTTGLVYKHPSWKGS